MKQNNLLLISAICLTLLMPKVLADITFFEGDLNEDFIIETGGEEAIVDTGSADSGSGVKKNAEDEVDYDGEALDTEVPQVREETSSLTGDAISNDGAEVEENTGFNLDELKKRVYFLSIIFVLALITVVAISYAALHSRRPKK